MYPNVMATLMGLAFFLFSSPFQAWSFQSPAVDSLHVLPHTSEKAEAFLQLGRSYQGKSADRFQELVRQAERIAHQMDDRKLQARALLSLAIASKQLGQLAMALSQVDSARYWFASIDDTKGMLEATLNKSNYLILVANWLEAEKNTHKALQMIRTDARLLQYQIPTLVQLAQIKVQLNDPSPTIALLREAVNLAKTHQREETLPLLYNNLGVVFADHLGQADSAIYYYEKGLSSIDTTVIESTNAAISLYLNLGDARWQGRSGDMVIAEGHYQKGFQLIQQSGIRVFEAQGLERLARLAMHYKNWTVADSLLHAALLVASYQHQPEIRAQVLQQLVKVDSTRGLFQEAYTKSQQLLQLRDSVMDAEAKLNAQQLLTRIELEQKSHELVLAQQAEQYQKQAFRLWVGLAGLSTLLLLVLVMRLLRDRKAAMRREEQERELRQREEAMHAQALQQELQEKKLLKQTLSYKSQRLQDFATLLHLKKDLLLEVSSGIKSIQQGESPEAVCKKLLQRLGGHLRIDQEQQALYLYMDEANQEFFQQLEEQFPNLSRNEKKLCGLLKLGLNNRELATLLNINPRSVEMARYRLRKKLSLTARQELVPYLHSLGHSLALN